MTTFNPSLNTLLLGSVLLLAGYGLQQQTTPVPVEQTALTEADAVAFLAKTETQLVQLATAAAKFDQLALSADNRRKLDKLKLALTLPAPQEAAKPAEMAKIVAELGGMYGKGKYCKTAGNCLSLSDLSAIMTSSRDYNELLEMWQGWREISKPMRPLYQRLITLTNEGV